MPIPEFMFVDRAPEEEKHYEYRYVELEQIHRLMDNFKSMVDQSASRMSQELGPSWRLFAVIRGEVLQYGGGIPEKMDWPQLVYRRSKNP